MEFTVQHMEKLLTILDGYIEIEKHASAFFNSDGKIEGFHRNSPLWKVSQVLQLVRDLSPLLTPEEAKKDYGETEFDKVLESKLPNSEKAALLMCMTGSSPADQDGTSDPNSPPW